MTSTSAQMSLARTAHRARVLEYLATAPEPLSPAQLAGELGFSDAYVRQLLARLEIDGEIERVLCKEAAGWVAYRVASAGEASGS